MCVRDACQALQDELDRRAAAEEALRLSLEQRELALQQLLSTTRAEPAAPALPPANTSHDDHVRAMEVGDFAHPIMS